MSNTWKGKRRIVKKNRAYERQRTAMARRAKEVRQLQRPCPKCQKHGYPTEYAATDAVITGGGRAGIRVYQCESGLWHTTNRD